MKRLGLTVLLAIAFLSAPAQHYYFNGAVKDERHIALQKVTITHPRTGNIYVTGAYGVFRVMLDQAVDTLVFSKEGFASQMIIVKTDETVSLILKAKPPDQIASMLRDRLCSSTKNRKPNEIRSWLLGNESYASIIENRFIEAEKFPNTGVALNIDKASYSNVRSYLKSNTLVPVAAVRTEEMLNYFGLDYVQPKSGETFHVRTRLVDCPWNKSTKLYYVNLSSQKLELDSLPPTHLTFLIDISGSMDIPNRLPLLKSAFRLLINHLRAKDSVSIVVYGSYTGLVLNATSGMYKDSILQAIDALVPGGATPGESGIMLAYEVAKNHFLPQGNNRVILATDGDFNVGIQSEQDLYNLIAQHQQTGIYLTCLGVGMGNYRDAKIQTLAQKGNGNFAFIDNYKEAEKILLREFSQTLYTLADDVYMNVTFNPDYVNEYRLIGFDNRLGAMRDSLAAIEGGEIGPANSLVAAFEIKPNENIPDTVSSFANIKLQYRLAEDTVQKHREFVCKYNPLAFQQLDSAYRFYSALILFASYLRESPFVGRPDWDMLLQLANETSSPNDLLQQEFITLTQSAKDFYTKLKKKRKKKR